MGAKAMKIQDEEETKVTGLSRDEITDFAKLAIQNYFANKPYYCGGPIPPHLLTARKRVDLVLDCTFDKAMTIAYEALEEGLTDDDYEYIDAGGVSPDIKNAISVLHGMARAGVPQELSNGMLILHLELVQGVDVVYA